MKTKDILQNYIHQYTQEEKEETLVRFESVLETSKALLSKEEYDNYLYWLDEQYEDRYNNSDN